MAPRRDNPAPPRARRRPRAEAAALAATATVIAAAGILAVSVFGSVGARISASTHNQSNVFEAAQIALRVDDEASLLFDVDGLYPGLELERCIPLSYVGSLDDVDIRLSARSDGGAGLERFIETSIVRGEGADPDCADFRPTTTLYEGLLVDVWAAHPDFTSGLPVVTDADNGFETMLRVTAEVVDDDDAQQLTTDFWMTIEARP